MERHEQQSGIRWGAMLLAAAGLFTLAGCVVPAEQGYYDDRRYDSRSRYDREYGYRRPVYVNDLDNRSTDHARNELRRRGFERMDQKKSRQGTRSWWYNYKTDQCIQMDAADGRVRSIRSSDSSRCPAPGSNRWQHD
ncbi:hypothetical protein Despr_2515 [Desulfobulbus propionicus DSM 2032]|uniref:Uncharacterized protein n=1 Tax=Desulfobulbus propionicus (strain ATCC 33891 / DSM 2032 / VKM B-1956 / 1pr3) TaxID=577650 RepID=A0A7U3YNT1_DESPD|nr:hypothetical protein [Desulfobulbus propionicus]ADW18653.1 hypothetical protein Despr_2515 [Desulfobulbus propionicus DSM 2032]